jgi:BASS family bile acid:Na+ symporter
MDLGSIANAAFGYAVLAIMFAMGLRTSPMDALDIVHHWRKGVRAFTAIYVVVPAVIMLFCYIFPLPPAAEAGLIALSVSPMLPTLPNDLGKLGAEHSYAISLEVVGAMAALIAAPVAFWVVSQITGLKLEIAAAPLLLSLAKGVLLPLVVGVAASLIVPVLARRVAGPLTAAAGIVLLISVLILIWKNWGFIAGAFSWPVLAGVVLLIVTGLAAGHFLAGPEPAERTALALTAASRHVGFAIAVGIAVAPRAIPMVAGTILIYFLLRGLVVLPYTRAAASRLQTATARGVGADER